MLNQTSTTAEQTFIQCPIEISDGKEKHNVQCLNIDGKCQYLVESKKCFDVETLLPDRILTVIRHLIYHTKNLALINVPGMCIVHS